MIYQDYHDKEFMDELKNEEILKISSTLTIFDREWLSSALLNMTLFDEKWSPNSVDIIIARKPLPSWLTVSAISKQGIRFCIILIDDGKINRNFVQLITHGRTILQRDYPKAQVLARQMMWSKSSKNPRVSNIKSGNF